jgi:hypothetical protein
VGPFLVNDESGSLLDLDVAGSVKFNGGTGIEKVR